MKNVLMQVWLFIARIFALFYLWANIYRFWSYTYRFLYERKFKDIKLPVANTMAEITKLTENGQWRQDSWRALFDSVSSPQRVYAIFSGQEPQPETDLDCDDFMSFTVNDVNYSLANGGLKGQGIDKAYCLTIMWIAKDTLKATGHNVALLESGQNDRTTLWAYMDYSGPMKQQTSIEDVVKQVLDTYAGKGNWECIGWCQSEDNLKPIKTSWGV